MLVVRLTAAIIVLHGILVLFWASCYRWLYFPSWEIRPSILGVQLYHRGLWRHRPSAQLEDVGAGGEHYRRFDVPNIGQRSVCDSDPVNQPRGAFRLIALSCRYSPRCWHSTSEAVCQTNVAHSPPLPRESSVQPHLLCHERTQIHHSR